MTARKHDTAHLRALRLRWLDGESIETLAAELGTSKPRLVSLWTTRGLTAELPKRRSYRISVAALRRIHARWCAGESIVNLADEAGMPRSTLWAMMRRAGLSLQRPDGLPQLGGDFNQERCRQRRKWYQWHLARSEMERRGMTSTGS